MPRPVANISNLLVIGRSAWCALGACWVHARSRKPCQSHPSRPSAFVKSPERSRYEFSERRRDESVAPAEEAAFPSPVPTQVVSSDEYFPTPQNAQQKEVEARLITMADSIAKKQGVSRRRFFQTASGMAASFVAMNAVYGEIFDATPLEAQTPEVADQRAKAGPFLGG